MKRTLFAVIAGVLYWAMAGMAFSFAASTLPTNAPYFAVRYPPATNEADLRLAVTFTVWMPPGVTTLRGIIVHQHGCGEGACKGGATAAYDLHWQALARKWDCALLGPSYEQKEADPCTWWCDPRNGSDAAFHRALQELALRTGHAELQKVPWLLWGHSGGANWAGNMLLLHPERIVAVWMRSGSPRLMSGRGSTNDVPVPPAALEVPAMCNLGAKEKDDRFASVWKSTVAFFANFRARGALIGFAPDPRTSHECGDSRYLAIPWFDACMEARLPIGLGTALRAMPKQGAWPPLLSNHVAAFPGAFTNVTRESVWLPNERVARTWIEYVKTGETSDSTPPPKPGNLHVSADGVLTWDAEADLESGLAGFIIERDGVEIGRVPKAAKGAFGRPLFQVMSYHDTPELPLPEMRFLVPGGRAAGGLFGVRSVNGAGLKSELAQPAAEEGKSPPRKP